MIHKRFKKYYKFSTKPINCSIANDPYDKLTTPNCGIWISCGGLPHSCLFNNSNYKLPCRYCDFWTGYGMKDWEIENAVVMMEIISISLKKEKL